MNPYFAVACLFALTTALFVLPLVPALLEFGFKSDALPLHVIQQHAGEIRYFADSFRTYLKTLEATLQECGSSGRNVSGIMPDGTAYFVLGSGNDALALPLQEKDQLCPLLIASATDLSLSPDSTFSKDLYSRGRFVGGANNRYRAILAEKELHLGAGSVVMRWVHAVGELNAEAGCKLYGRASSDCRIRLAAGCSFVRLNAPRIEVGPQSVEPPLPLSNAPLAPAMIPGRLLHDRDFEIAEGELFRGNLVVRGKLFIGAGARVAGSVKSANDMIVSPGASVEGSLISAGRLRIGSGCKVHGPIIAERELLIGEGAQCGSSQSPATLTAMQIKVAQGVLVFGSIWARERGEVVSSL